MPAVKNSGKTGKQGSRPPAKKTGARTARPPSAERSAAKRQLAAIILFCISVFLICLCFIDGGGVWGWLRNGSFGLFGFSAYLIPLILIYIAIMATLDKTSEKVGTKVAEAVVLIFLIGAAIHIFRFDGTVAYRADIKAAFNVFRNDGSSLGCGAAGALLGGLLLLATGSSRAPAAAIVLILIFLCLMLITGTTLIKLFKGFMKPVEKVHTYREEKLEQLAENQNRAQFDLDVDLGPDPEKDRKKRRKEKPVTTLEEEAELAKRGENSGSAGAKPVQIDDIIRNMHASPAQETAKPAEEKEKPSVFAQAGENEAGQAEKQYIMPPLNCLSLPKNADGQRYEEELKSNATKLVDTLKSFGVETRIVDISRGPSVTRYEIQPAAGVKISRITNLADDIALNLAAAGVRIEAPIPNKAAVGIEIPNRHRSIVTLRENLDTEQYRNAKSRLFVALGKDIAGSCTYADLAKMPHLLVAGTTGSGKSVCLNSMIVSILYHANPDEVKLLMIDPKQVEFTVYNGIPHLIVPVVCDPRKASGALAWAVTEMLTRYKMFSENNVRDIGGYNSICEGLGHKKMPQIVIFIDELSDLMMAAPHEVEDSICRLAQMARAAGMHLVVATQRPTVDVITGLIKANIPSRISLKVSSHIESRIIIDMGGADKLLGNGDLLFYPVGAAKPIRIQGCYLSEKEVETVVGFIKKQEQSAYDDEVMREIERQAASDKKKQGGLSEDEEGGGEADEMMPKAIEVVVEAQMASTTLLQRRLKLGYARAARIMDELEERGIVGPYEGSKPRKVLITKQQWYEMNALAQSGAHRDYSAEGAPPPSPGGAGEEE